MKYKKSGLDSERKFDIANKVRRYFEQEKGYLSSSCDLQTLSEDIGLPKHHISESLNFVLKKSFWNLLNMYRVEEVKKRMLDESNQKFTLLGIAYDSGFNSKASFNRVFKQYTGYTPSYYKVMVSSAQAA